MDKFTYTLAIKKIDTFKTLKAKDAFIREHVKELTGGDKWYHKINKTNIEQSILLFKCITKCLTVYDVKRLPDNIQRSIKVTSKMICKLFCEKEGAVTYDKFIDTFQYLKVLECSIMSPMHIRNMAIIFKDNPLQFPIKYGLSINAKYRYVSETGKDTSIHKFYIPEILQVEEIKRSLPDTTSYTILEDMLSDYYTEFNIPLLTDRETFLTEIVEEMENLVTIANTLKTRAMKE